MDPGNIAGTIGIVANGATGILQSVEVITNGSLLNSIIGDAAGTLYQFKTIFGVDIEKAIKAIEDAKKRVEAGAAAYERYKNEVEQRKAQYQALMDKLNSSRGKENYDDSDNLADNRNDRQPTGNSSSTSSSTTNSATTRDNNNTNNNHPRNFSEPENIVVDDSIPTNSVPSSSGIIRNEVSAQSGNAYVNPTSDLTPGFYNSPETTQDDTGYHRRRFEPLEDESITDDSSANATNDAGGASGSTVTTPTSTDTPQPSGNTSPFDRWLTNTEDTSNDIATPTNVVTGDEENVPPSTTSGTSSGGNSNGVSGGDGHGDITPETDLPSTANPIEDRNQGRGGMDNKSSYDVSSAELSFTSSQIFASETSGNDEIGSTKGVNYSAKGDFVTPLAKRCGLSVQDLVDLEKMKSCLTKIVAENNARDMTNAQNSRKDCQNMVFETVVALSAEATKAKNEASNYKDTLDEQAEHTATSSTTRDDGVVHALGNEQIQILLNKMSSLLSGEIVFEATNQLCSLSRDVFVDNTEAEGDGEPSSGNGSRGGENGNTQPQNTEPTNPNAEYEWFQKNSKEMTVDEINEYLKNGGKLGTNPYKNGGQPSQSGTSQGGDNTENSENQNGNDQEVIHNMADEIYNNLINRSNGQ